MPAPDFKEVRSGFPIEVWDGTSQSRSADAAADRDAPDGHDRVRMVTEIIKLQEAFAWLASLKGVALVLPDTASLNGTETVEVLDVSWTISGGVNYTGTIDWGDGTVEEITLNQTSLAHTYEDPGTYSIIINGTNPCGETTTEVNVHVTTSPS